MAMTIAQKKAHVKKLFDERLKKVLANIEKMPEDFDKSELYEYSRSQFPEDRAVRTDLRGNTARGAAYRTAVATKALR